MCRSAIELLRVHVEEGRQHVFLLAFPLFLSIPSFQKQSPTCLFRHESASRLIFHGAV